MEARFQARTTWTMLLVIAFGSLVLGAVVGCARQSGSGSTQVADRSVPGQSGQSAPGSGTRQADPPAAPARVAHPVALESVGDMALSTGLGLPPGGVAGALGRCAPSCATQTSPPATSRAPCRSAGHRSAAAATPAPVSRSSSRPLTPASTARSGSTSSTRPTTTRWTTAPRAQPDAGGPEAGRVAYTGLPGQITYLDVRGARVAFIGFAPYSGLRPRATSAARQRWSGAPERTPALVVVIIHAGAEGSDAVRTPRHRVLPRREPRQPRAFAHGVINAGASIVLRIRPARDPRRRALPRAHDRLFAGQLRRLQHARPRRRAVRERDPAGDPASGKVLARRWIRCCSRAASPHADPAASHAG